MEEEFMLLEFLKNFLQESYSIRRDKQAEGIYVPMFLSANITEHQNPQGMDNYLMRMRTDPYVNQQEEQYMGAKEWDQVFYCAQQLGIRIIFIKGGEPLTRKCILEMAAGYRKIFFPVFTNGSMLDEHYVAFFQEHRNLIPIIGMEGDGITDVSQTGKGSARYTQSMQSLEEIGGRGILFGTQEWLNRWNYQRLLNRGYTNELRHRGVSLVLYQISPGSAWGKAPISREELDYIERRIRELSGEYREMGFFLMPGEGVKPRNNIFWKEGLFEIAPDGTVYPMNGRKPEGLNVRRLPLGDILKHELYQIEGEGEA